MTPNQLGTFKVDDRFFDRIGPREGTNLFHDMVVLDIQHDYLSRNRTYFAVHPSFRPVLPGEKYPEYIAIFHKGTALPQWQEVEQPKGWTHETLDRIRNDVGISARARDEYPEPAGAAEADFIGRLSKHCVVTSVEHGQRPGWLDRLLQRGRALLQSLLGHRGAAASDDVSEGRQQLRAGVLGSADRGQQHDTHGDGVSRQGARGHAGVAGTGYLAAAGLKADGYTQARGRIDIDLTDHCADSDAGPYCGRQQAGEENVWPDTGGQSWRRR